MVSPRPLLSDIQSDIKFKDGDRIIVRVSDQLMEDQYARLKKAIKKFARADVRILIVDVTYIRIVHVLSEKNAIEVIAGRKSIQAQSQVPGTTNVSCSVVDLKDGDVLKVTIDPSFKESKHIWKQYIRNWIGKGVELWMMEGKV